MSIEFRYQLVGTGWSACKLTVDGSQVNVTASYLSDALGSLIAALCRVLNGQPDSTAIFEEEPGEYRWRFFRVDDTTIRLLILQFDGSEFNQPESEGISIFDVRCRLWTFAGAVFDGCQRLLEEHGREGYGKLWVGAFPDAEFAELKQLLDAKR